MDLQLTNKSVVVTGAGSNIGRAIATVFGLSGAKVAILDIDKESAEKVAAELSAADGCPGAIGIYCDVTDPTQISEALKQVEAANGPIEIWVNNVGWTMDRLFLEKPREELEKEVQLNFWGTINCVQQVLPGMVERGSGSIVTIASDAGRVGEYREAVYSGCKAGVIAFSKAIAKEYGPKGIRLNVVCPGVTVPAADEMSKDSMWTSLSSVFTPEIQKRVAKGYPLRRLGTAKDTALATAFLASGAASFITGQTLSVSGGYSMM